MRMQAVNSLQPDDIWDEPRPEFFRKIFEKYDALGYGNGQEYPTAIIVVYSGGNTRTITKVEDS